MNTDPPQLRVPVKALLILIAIVALLGTGWWVNTILVGLISEYISLIVDYQMQVLGMASILVVVPLFNEGAKRGINPINKQFIPHIVFALIVLIIAAIELFLSNFITEKLSAFYLGIVLEPSVGPFIGGFLAAAAILIITLIIIEASFRIAFGIDVL